MTWDVKRLALMNPSTVAITLNNFEDRISELELELKAIAGTKSPETSRTLRESQAAIVRHLEHGGYEVNGRSTAEAVKSVMKTLKEANAAKDVVDKIHTHFTASQITKGKNPIETAKEIVRELQYRPSHQDIKNAREDAEKYGKTLSLIREILTAGGVKAFDRAESIHDGAEIKSTSDMVKEAIAGYVENASVQAEIRLVREELSDRGYMASGYPLRKLVTKAFASIDKKMDDTLISICKALEISLPIEKEKWDSPSGFASHVIRRAAETMEKFHALARSCDDMLAEVQKHEQFIRDVAFQIVVPLGSKTPDIEVLKKQIDGHLNYTINEHFLTKQEVTRLENIIHTIGIKLGVVATEPHQASVIEIEAAILRILDRSLPPAGDVTAAAMELSDHDQMVQKQIRLIEERLDRLFASATPIAAEPFEMELCETKRVVLQPRLYRFFVDATCKACFDMAHNGNPLYVAEEAPRRS